MCILNNVHPKTQTPQGCFMHMNSQLGSQLGDPHSRGCVAMFGGFFSCRSWRWKGFYCLLVG